MKRWGKFAVVNNLISATVVLLLVNASRAEFVFQPILEIFPTNSQPKFPYCRLLEVSNGVFYGVSTAGGTRGNGTVFKITAAGELSVLYSFIPELDGYDGAVDGLIRGDDGNLYGVTATGGVYAGDGTIFRISPDGAFSTIYVFNSDRASSTNGIQPFGPLAKGNDGSFYGIASYGGEQFDYGMVFRITTNGILTRLASFHGTNGANPFAGLILASDGSFYGMTYGLLASVDYNGRIFKVTTNGELTTLVSFNGTNGSIPGATRLVQGSDGDFYGTTKGGGMFDRGTVFRMKPDGALTTLYSFDGTNGSLPGTLTFWRDNNLYGLAAYRLENGTITNGTLFKITTNGLLTTLVRFNGTNADRCYADLTLATDGNLYGAISDANRHLTADGNGGLVFRLVESPTTSLSRSNESVQFSWTSFTNGIYRLDFKTLLDDTNWTSLASNITATAVSTTWTDFATSASRFYRVVLLP